MWMSFLWMLIYVLLLNQKVKVFLITSFYKILIFSFLHYLPKILVIIGKTIRKKYLNTTMNYNEKDLDIRKSLLILL